VDRVEEDHLDDLIEVVLEADLVAATVEDRAQEADLLITADP
jgi:hypothetical protein